MKEEFSPDNRISSAASTSLKPSCRPSEACRRAAQPEAALQLRAMLDPLVPHAADGRRGQCAKRRYCRGSTPAQPPTLVLTGWLVLAAIVVLMLFYRFACPKESKDDLELRISWRTAELRQTLDNQTAITLLKWSASRLSTSACSAGRARTCATPRSNSRAFQLNESLHWAAGCVAGCTMRPCQRTDAPGWDTLAQEGSRGPARVYHDAANLAAVTARLGLGRSRPMASRCATAACPAGANQVEFLRSNLPRCSRSGGDRHRERSPDSDRDRARSEGRCSTSHFLATMSPTRTPRMVSWA